MCMRMCIALCTPGEVSFTIVTTSLISNTGGPRSRALTRLTLSCSTVDVASDVEDLLTKRLQLMTFLFSLLLAWHSTYLLLFLRVFLLPVENNKLMSRVSMI